MRRVIADKVIHYSDDRTDADHPRYITLTPNKPQVDASSDRGWTHDAGKTIEFEGNVKILRDPAGSTPALSFETQKMTAFPDTERFTSDSPVASIVEATARQRAAWTTATPTALFHLRAASTRTSPHANN